MVTQRAGRSSVGSAINIRRGRRTASGPSLSRSSSGTTPREFRQRVDAAIGEPDKRTRRDTKRQLLEDVRAWLDEDTERGRAALAESAASVIGDLGQIADQLAASS
jgi:hypothetical protein